MTRAGCRNVCTVMAAAGASWIQLVLPPDFKRPIGFPRGELMCVNGKGGKVYRFTIARMLRWLDRPEAS